MYRLTKSGFPGSKRYRGFSGLYLLSVVRHGKQTFSASIKLSTHAYMTFIGFDTNLQKACDDGWIDHVSDRFISVKVVAGKYLTN